MAPSAPPSPSHACSATWCASVSTKLAAAGLSPHPVTMVCIPTVFPPPHRVPAPPPGATAADADGTPDHFDAYVAAALALPDRTFTDVLIDGRARVACALALLPHITPASVVLLHDAQRWQYAPIYDWYDKVASTPAGSVPQLVVLRPKPAARLPGGVPVAAATVGGIYARLRAGGWVAGASAQIAERVRTGAWVAGTSDAGAAAAGGAAAQTAGAAAAAAAAAAAVGAATVPGA